MAGLESCLIVAAAAAISAAVVAALLPLLRRHALAHPNARSSHRVATPQGGGIAVVMAAVAVAAAGLEHSTATLGLFAAGAFIAAVGLADDIWTIPVAPRLLLQAVAVALMLASLPAELRLVPALPWGIERALLLVACLWFVNLTNFMDGLDWMTVAEFVPMALGLALIGALGGLPREGIVVALALGGGLLGFAPFNRPVARIFLGDVGSLPIGLLFAWLLVLLAGQGHVGAALLLPLYYLADATLTLFRRVRKGERFWQAHRTHFYQRATDGGFAVREIVGRVFAVNLALLALALATVQWPSTPGSVIALIVGAALVGALLRRFDRGKR